jgi:hypothetical protein
MTPTLTYSNPGSPLAAHASFEHGVVSMPHRHWRATLLALVTAFTLAGCAGNYKFDDDSYRPLGDPQALNRDN